MSNSLSQDTKKVNVPSDKQRYLSLLPPSEKGQVQRDRLAMIMVADVKIPSSTFSDQELILVLESDESSPADVAQHIKLDPYLSTRIFSVARSAAFRGRQDIETFEEACFRLGMLELKRLVYSAQVAQSFSKFETQVDWPLFWLKSILTARLADKFLRTFLGGSNLGFLTGLLHDTGSLILWEYFPDECRFIEKLLEGDLEVIEAEMEVLGFTHAHASGLLCSKWNFPDKVIQGVLNMHAPLKSIPDADAALYSGSLLLASNLTMQILELDLDRQQDPSKEPIEFDLDEIQDREEWRFMCSLTSRQGFKFNVNLNLELESAKVLASSLTSNH